MSTSRYVLDSYAVLALLYEEPGWESVKEMMNAAAAGSTELHISIINMIEVKYRIIREKRATPRVLAALQALPITVASADGYADQVASLKAAYPVSLADCFAAALAIDLDCPVITGDPEFAKLLGKVRVEWST